MPSSPLPYPVRRSLPFAREFGFVVCCLGTALPGAEEMAKKMFDLPAGDALVALKAFAQQSGTELLYSTKDIAGARTNGVKGEFTPREALGRMLEGSGLIMTEGKAKAAIAVTRAPRPNGERAASTAAGDRPNNRTGSDESPELHPTMKSKNPIAALFGWMALTLTPSQSAEVSLPPNSPGAGAGQDDSVFVMSPFTVDSTQDRGYQAANTLSGTRLNSSLSDTPASVSVMTQEFLQDVGLDSLRELVGYSVNSEVDEFDTSSGSHPDQINSQYLVKLINTRGIRASQALDYFKSITPDDSYRIERYDDSRGPNGILFGISDAGGLINQTSRVADTLRDRARLKWSTGSHERNRTEVSLNKIVRDKSVAVSISGLHQENGGWKLYEYEDKQRLFGALLIRPHRRISINLMGERGHDVTATAPAFTPRDQALAWMDNRNARGIGAVTFTPLNANPTAAQQALGVTSRNAAANGTNRRITFIANDGMVFDSVGTFLTGSYNIPAVRAPDGSQGGNFDVMRVNDPAFLPYEVNAPGPGMYRDARIKNYTASADWQIAGGMFANVAHNFQRTELTAYFMPLNSGPDLRGEPNTTLGIGGPPNPYAGRLYFEAPWRRGTHPMERTETRLSLSYDLKTPRLGSHRFAGMASRVREEDFQVFSYLALAGSPFGGAADSTNNRVTMRQYIDESDPRTFTGGHWRDVPSRLTVGGRTYDVTWANAGAGQQNSAVGQRLTTGLIVAQSHFFGRRLVTTLGYREDEANFITYGYGTDPNRGVVIDYDRAKATEVKSRGVTRTQGVVLHVGRGISLVANGSTNMGLPEYTRRLFPDASVPPPSKGKGQDFGIAASLWDRKLTAKASYYETAERGKVALYNSVNLFANMNIRVMDAFESVLAGTGRPISSAEWAALRAEMTPAVNGVQSEIESRGYEFNAIANPLPNFRLTVNYAYADRKVTNLYMRDAVPWYGFKVEGNGLIRQGVTQDGSGAFVLDPGAYEAGGAIAKWVALAQRDPEAALSSLLTSNGRSIAQEVFTTTEGMNDQKLADEKRWGLRPHRVSVFAAYDFKKENWLKGVSVGAGYRWRSPNILGTDVDGREIDGRAIRETDFMMRYSRRVKPALWKGNLILQVNVINALNEKGIIPRYLAVSPPYEVPGGRGIAYNRFDVIAPRAFRFTTTYEF